MRDKSAKHSLQALGLNLQRLRKEAALSQDALAVKADVTKRYIQMIEAGQKCPTLLTLKRLTGALGCNYDDLLADF